MKVIGLFGLKLKILITVEPIEFSILARLYLDPVMVLGYLLIRLKSWDPSTIALQTERLPKKVYF